MESNYTGIGLRGTGCGYGEEWVWLAFPPDPANSILNKLRSPTLTRSKEYDFMSQGFRQNIPVDVSGFSFRVHCLISRKVQTFPVYGIFFSGEQDVF